MDYFVDISHICIILLYHRVLTGNLLDKVSKKFPITNEKPNEKGDSGATAGQSEDPLCTVRIDKVKIYLIIDMQGLRFWVTP